MGLSLKKLKDIGSGVVRQVNPFDNGATYKNPTPVPQAPVVNNNRNVAQKAWDQVNPWDNGRTAHNAAPTNTRSVVGQATHNGVTNTVGNLLVKPFLINPLQIAAETERMTAADVTQNVAAQKASQERQARNLHASIPGFMYDQVVNGAKAVKEVPGVIAGEIASTSSNPYIRQAGIDRVNAGKTKGLTALNQTTVGQMISPAESAIVSNVPGAKEDAAAAGYDVNASGFKKYLADPIMGTVGTVGLVTGAKSGIKNVREALPARTVVEDTAAAKPTVTERTAPPKAAPKQQAKAAAADETVIEQTARPTAPKPKITQKVDVGNIGGARDQFGKLMIDEDAPLINLMRRIDKPNGTKNEDTFMYNSSLQRNAPKIAHGYFMRSKEMQTAIGGLDKNARADFSQYASARRELANAKEGMKTSAPVDELQQVVAEGHQAFDGRYQALNGYYKTLADAAHNAGLISDETLAHYNKDGDYIRLQRDMGDLVERPVSNRSYRRGSTIMNQKRTGSTRTVVDPVATALDYTRRITGEQMQNTTASHLIRTMHEAGQTKQLINADDVAARRAAFARMAELKPIKAALKKQVASAAKIVNDTAARNDYLGPKILKGIKRGEKPTRDAAIRKANNVERSQGAGSKLSVKPSQAHIEEAFQEYLDGNPQLVNRMKEFLGNKATQEKTMAQLERLKRDYAKAKAESKHQWLTAKQHADQVTKNKNTVSFMRNGIRETHEVHAEVKKAMENIKPYDLGIPGQIVGAPARLLRAGATALNPVFTLSNVVKDQVGSAVISSKARVTHSPANVKAGVVESVKSFAGAETNPLWHEFEKVGGDITQYDLTRNVKGTNEIIARKAGGKKVGAYQAAIHTVRTLEDANAITEKATRFQNFKGIYEDAMKNGKTHDEAVQDATLAALNHTVNFGRAGSAGRIINLIVPYSNAAIQGGRTLANATKARPYSTVSKGFAWVGTPIAAATMWNTADPERKKVYENIRPFEKQNNLIFIKPGTKVTDITNGSYEDKVIKVPLPPDIGSIFQPIRRAIEQATGSGAKVSAREVATDVTKPFVGPLDLSSGSGLVSSATPQALKVVVNQAANRDFYTGKQIVPDYMKDATTDPTKRVTPFTSSTARKTSEVIKKVTGKSVEPVRIDKFATDVAGKIGSFGINASDHALAATGQAAKDPKTGKNIIGGQDVLSAFAARFQNASASEDPNNKTAQYYKKVAEQYNKLDKNGKAAFDALHPTKVDGEKPDKTLYDASFRATTYLKNPAVLAADQAVNKDSKDPFWHLPAPQQKVIMTLDTLSDDPGSNTAKKISKDNPWLQDYYSKRGDFFDSIAKTGTAKTSDGNTLPKAPVATGDTKTHLDEYSSITDSKAKAVYIQDHQDISDYFAANDTYQRQKRTVLGLPQFDKYPTASADVQRKLDVYNSLPQHDGKKGGNATRSAYLKANPDVSNYFAAASEYGVVKDAQMAVFEGEELSDKSQKALGGGGSSYGSSSKSGVDYINPYAHVVKSRGSVKAAPKVTAHITPRKAKVAAKRKSTITSKLTKAKA